MVAMGTRPFHRLRKDEFKQDLPGQASGKAFPILSTAWVVLRKHPIRSDVRCGICDAWGSNCASVGCRPGFASREDTDSTGYQHSDSTRFPRNSVGKGRTGSGRTGPNRRWSTCVPMRGHMPVGLELHAPWWRLRARSSAPARARGASAPCPPPSQRHDREAGGGGRHDREAIMPLAASGSAAC